MCRSAWYSFFGRRESAGCCPASGQCSVCGLRWCGGLSQRGHRADSCGGAVGGNLSSAVSGHHLSHSQRSRTASQVSLRCKHGESFIAYLFHFLDQFLKFVCLWHLFMLNISFYKKILFRLKKSKT